jgi:hypothetical protein
MARIRSRGSAFGSLDERRQTLEEVIARLGFRKLSEAEEESVRGTLSIAIGQWRMAEGTGSTAGLTVRSVTTWLRGLAKDLENAARTLSAASTGIHRNDDIEIAMRLADALRHLPGCKSMAEAQAALSRFAEEASVFAQAARVAAKLLDTTPSSPGRARQEWHDTFVEGVSYLCRLNRTPTTVTTHRITGESTGQILEVMCAIEALLPKGMRAPSNGARVTRLKRSRRRQSD